MEEEAAAVALEDADMPDEGGDEPIEPDAEDESGPGEENLDRKDISGCCNCACEVVFFLRGLPTLYTVNLMARFYCIWRLQAVCMDSNITMASAITCTQRRYY